MYWYSVRAHERENIRRYMGIYSETSEYRSLTLNADIFMFVIFGGIGVVRYNIQRVQICIYKKFVVRVNRLPAKRPLLGGTYKLEEVSQYYIASEFSEVKFKACSGVSSGVFKIHKSSEREPQNHTYYELSV